MFPVIGSKFGPRSTLTRLENERITRDDSFEVVVGVEVDSISFEAKMMKEVRLQFDEFFFKNSISKMVYLKGCLKDIERKDKSFRRKILVRINFSTQKRQKLIYL